MAIRVLPTFRLGWPQIFFSKNGAEKGFTLVELMTVLVILGILTAGAVVGTGWLERWQTAAKRQSMINEASMALNRMVREMRVIRDRSSVTLAGPSRLVFVDAGGRQIDLNLAGTKLCRNIGSEGNMALAENISDFRFSYYRSDLEPLDGSDETHTVYTDGYTNIRLIRITMGMAGDGQTIRMMTSVAPSNLQLE